jgi:hypothetical protein
MALKKFFAFVSVLLAMAFSAAGCMPFRSMAANSTRPAAATSAAAARTPKPTPTPKPAPTKNDILDAFKTIAFASEYGSSGAKIRKWTKEMKVEVHGDPTGEDLDALEKAMDGLNGVDGFPGIGTVKSGGNVDIWFVPLDQMSYVIPEYVEGNWGFFYTHFGSGGGITSASIAIATDVTEQDARNHLIQEELIQSTGLMQDNYDRPDSIFYGKWTTVQQPTALDWELVRILYMKGIKPGMPSVDAMSYLIDNYKAPDLKDGEQ